MAQPTPSSTVQGIGADRADEAQSRSSGADPSSFIKEVVRCGSPGPVREPWTAMIAALMVPARPLPVEWPDSLRHVVRCLGGVDENGAEQALFAEPGHKVDVDTLVLAALTRGPMPLEMLARATGRSGKPLRDQLARLRREGRVHRVDVGVWASTAPRSEHRNGN